MDFINNTFTASDGSNLSAYSGEGGVSYSKHPSFTNDLLIQSNRVAKDNSGGTTAYLASPTPPQLEYTIEVDVVDIGNVNRAAGIQGWMSPTADTAILIRRQNATTWQLAKVIAGTLTSLETVPTSFVQDAATRIKLRRFNGNNFEFIIGGIVSPASPHTIADSQFQSVGKVGFRASNNHSGTGYHLDNLIASIPLPSAPSALTLNAVAGTQVDLSWTDNSDNETSFRVERKTGAGGTYAEIGSNTANDTTYSDLTASPSTTYFYRVRARNAAGDSAYLSEQSVTTPGGGPAAPSNLTLTAVSGTQVDLVWNDNSNDEDSFRIERKTGAGGTYLEVGSNPANDVTFSDTSVSPSTTYFYRVKARNVSGDSAYLQEKTITTPAGGSPPNAPSSLTVVALSEKQVLLVWTDNSTDEESFRVERKTGVGGAYSEIGSTATNISAYHDYAVAPGTTYVYRVRARNGNGDSSYSIEQSVTMPAAGTTVTIRSGNLQHGQGTDGAFNYARQVNALTPGADIVCVQERSTSDTGWDSALAAAGFTQAVFKAHWGNPGDGNAVWIRDSTVTLLQTYTFDMTNGVNPTSGSSVFGWNGTTDIRRSLCAVKVQVGSQQFYVVSWHLVSNSGEDNSNTNFASQRVDQINSSMSWKAATLTGGLPVIWAGDINLPPNYPRAPELSFTADFTTDIITMSGPLPNGTAVALRNAGGSIPGGLATGDSLYAQAPVFYVRDSVGNTCKLSSTPGGSAVDLQNNGTGSHFIAPTQWDLIRSGHYDLWQEGLTNGKSRAPWGNRDGNGQPDMPVDLQLTITHDTRRIDGVYLDRSSSGLTLRSTTVFDHRAPCPHALSGTPPACTPEVGQLTGTVLDMGVRPGDHNFLEAVFDIVEETPPQSSTSALWVNSGVSPLEHSASAGLALDAEDSGIVSLTTQNQGAASSISIGASNNADL